MNKKILVIEDEIHIRELIVELLEDANFQVISSGNGNTGLALAEEQVPDLVICDIMMPGLDGYEVLRRIRQNLRTTTIPLIFLTAKTERIDFRKGMVMGADDYITKPFTCDELLESINTRLAKYALIQQTCNIQAQLSQLNGPRKVPVKHSIQESHLYQALEYSEFELYYQPQIDIKTGGLVGAEALIRWNSTQFGFMEPVEFIALAEETGFIILLDQWVIQTACAQAKMWQRCGLPPLRIAINLSSLQFNHPHLTERIAQVLRSTELHPQCLEIELTESLLVQDVDETIRRLQELKELSIQIAIDDFGTGYASLGYLQHFPFDILKLDQCFVRDVNSNSTNAAIATAVIKMAHDLNLTVIAEGVETESERQFLLTHQCDVIQGFLMSHPLSAEDFGAFQSSLLKTPLSTYPGCWPNR